MCYDLSEPKILLKGETSMNTKPGMVFSLEELRAPKNEYAVTYMWFWNEPITRELIASELSEYKKAGISSIYIVPLPKDFRPETIRTYLSPEYLTEEFFDLAEYAIRRAIELGMKPWIYDEGGWPSGGACYHTLRENPNAKMKVLDRRAITLEGGEKFQPENNFIALFDGKSRLPDDYVASDRITLTAYYVKEIIENGNRVDYTNGTVTETFIKNTYEKYKERLGDLFGKDLPIIFTDEPGLYRNSLADNEFALFEAEFGYDLRDYVYVIENGGSLAVTEDEIRARIDHGILLGKLFCENTFKKLHDWCEESSIYFSGHLDIDNRPFGGMEKGVFSMLDALRNFHVPGIDVIWEQIRYPHSGRAPVDDETLGFGFFPRLAPSAARQTGRNVTVTESLGIYGDGLTHDEIRFVINYQMIRGINAINFAPISIGKSRLSCILSRPNFRPEKPGFFNMRELHEYFARLSYLARLGYAEGDTAIYMPCRDYCADPKSCDAATDSFKSLGTELEERNVAFDIIDDAGILAAEDTGNGLKIGNAVYRNIAMPECSYMPESVRKKIEKYIGCGEPTYLPENKNLRFMTRKLYNSRLWFVFNEGIECASEAFDVSENYTYVYRIDCRMGEIYSYHGEAVDIPCGEILVLLATDERLDSVSDAVEYSVNACEFSPIAHKRFVIEYDGIKNEWGDGSIIPGESFSGEITYKGRYTLPEEPKSDERYRVRLDGFSASACVKLGECEIPLGLSPMYSTLSGKHLTRDGVIEVTVANTALNEIYAKMDTINLHPKAEIGPYAHKMEEFEKRRAPLNFGRVTIEKLS